MAVGYPAAIAHFVVQSVRRNDYSMRKPEIARAINGSLPRHSKVTAGDH
jgi:hypothetical protein